MSSNASTPGICSRALIADRKSASSSEPASCRREKATEWRMRPGVRIGMAPSLREAAPPPVTSRADAEGDLVLEAPVPVLAGLERAHDRVPGVAIVRAGVLVRAGVAASDLPALR